jgi:serine/threonine protein kinase
MNKRNIYHCDIKNSNVLVDSSKKTKTRLIDWGLSIEYKPFKNEKFPRTWRNRPLQFNVPFSVIIFTDYFYEKYIKFIKDGGIVDEIHLKPFVIDYLKIWMDERGAGHYKFINEIMYILFSSSLTSTSTESKSKIVETQITINYIVNYIIDVLIHFTKFRKDGTLNLRDYLDNVFIKIVDIWGFISIYLPIIEILFNNYSNLQENELKIFNKLKYIFVYYLYNPRHEPINIDNLFSELNKLQNLILVVVNQKTKIQNYSARGIYNKKTIKNKLNIKSTKNISFKRKPKQRRFKNPFLLSLK